MSAATSMFAGSMIFTGRLPDPKLAAYLVFFTVASVAGIWMLTGIAIKTFPAIRIQISRLRATLVRRIERSCFAVLVRLGLQRLLHSAESNQDDLQSSVGVLFGLLALPGALVSILLFEKYGSLFHWMYGILHFDIYSESLGDEYLFITFAMAVCGAVAVWKWDLILPEKRDYMALVPLPLRSRSLFLANATALAAFTFLFALVVNSVSVWLFPLVASAAVPSLKFIVIFALAHALAVLLASIFGSVAVFATVGILMAILPEALFRRLSVIVRSLYLSCLLVLLFSVLVVPEKLKHLERAPRLLWVPSIWFLGICQMARGQHVGLWLQAASIGIVAIFAAIMICGVAYGLAYRRYFLRIPERTEVVAGSRSPLTHRMSRWADRWLLRTPFQRGGYRFSIKTLLRSDPHRLMLTAFAVLGIIVGFALLRGGVRISPSTLPTAVVLAAPLPLVFTLAVGLRLAFDVPTDLRAKWVFQMTLGPATRETYALARKLMLTVLLPFIWAIVLPAYSFAWNWRVGLLHAAVLTATATLVCEILLLNFHKIPFTCAPAGFGQNYIARILVALLVCTLAIAILVRLELWTLHKAAAVASLVLLFSAGWWAVARYRQDQPDLDRELSFDDVPSGAFQLLNLSDR